MARALRVASAVEFQRKGSWGMFPLAEKEKQTVELEDLASFPFLRASVFHSKYYTIMVSSERIKWADFLPAGAQLLRCVWVEAANICSRESDTEHLDVENLGEGALEIRPQRIVIACPVTSILARSTYDRVTNCYYNSSNVGQLTQRT